MIYEGINIFDTKDRDMLIMSNLSDVQELIQMRRFQEANERLNALKLMMIKTRPMLDKNPEGFKLVPIEQNLDDKCTPFNHCQE